MAWVNDVCAVKDTKSLLKKPLGLEVKENKKSRVFYTDYFSRILSITLINTHNTSVSVSHSVFNAAITQF